MRVELVTFTASILINVAILGSFDKAATRYEKVLTQEKRAHEIEDKLGGLAFEFVEAPKKSVPKPPAKTKKISDRDAVAQNPVAAPAGSADTTPKIDSVGPSDQLEQKRALPTQPPISASKPAPEIKPTSQPKDVSTPSTEMAERQKLEAEPQNEKIQDPSKYSPDQKASQPVVGLTGADRITTKAMTRTQSRGAQLIGESSFEAMGSDMGIYFKNMKERIWLAWFPYLSIHYPKDFRSADVVVQFYLNRDGEVLRSQVLEYKGSPLFAAFCMESVKMAGPFGKVPPEVLDLLGKDELEVKFGFHFW